MTREEDACCVVYKSVAKDVGSLPSRGSAVSAPAASLGGQAFDEANTQLNEGYTMHTICRYDYDVESMPSTNAQALSIYKKIGMPFCL